MATVLVAGATGALGRELLAELRRRGHRTRALVRDRARGAGLQADEVAVGDLTGGPVPLEEACRGAAMVMSAAGATPALARRPRHETFRRVDRDGHLRLVAAAERAGVERFGYVTLLNAQRLRGLRYVDAHEDVVAALRRSPMAATIVRANGFFSAYGDMLRAARRGPLLLPGRAGARSNPIHEADLAAACADALEQGAHEVEVGGPETMTRDQEARLCFAALGRTPRVRFLPPAAGRAVGRAVRLADPRTGDMLAFLATVCEIDMVGPAHGSRRLGDWLRERAAVS